MKKNPLYREYLKDKPTNPNFSKLRELQKSLKNPKRIMMYEYMQFYKGKWYRRIFGARKVKGKSNRIEIRELYVKREDWDIDLMSGCMYCFQICGWVPRFDTFRSYYYGYQEEADFNLYEHEGNFNPNVCRMYELSDLITQDERLKYSCIEDVRPYDVLKYIQKYLKHPKIELLVKSGLSYLWTDGRVLKLSKNKEKQFMTFCRNNMTYIKEYLPSYNFISNCIRNNISAEEKVFRDKVIYNQERLNTDHNTALTVTKYLAKQKASIYTYCDYLEQCKELNRDMTCSQVLYPKDLQEEHEKLSIAIRTKRDEKIQNQIQEIYKKIRKFEKNYNGFSIKFPSSIGDFIEQGNKLHQCVGTAGYDKKMADGEIYIVFINDINGNSLETAEIDISKKKVVQLYGDHNSQDFEYHPGVEKAVDLLITDMKKKRGFAYA